MPRHANFVDLPTPSTRAVTFEDPRPSRRGADAGIVAFCCLPKEEPIDVICGAGFLSNYFDLSPGVLELMAPANRSEMKTFKNAEAAFHALKFWRQADTYALISAEQAWQRHRKATGNEDSTYAGFGGKFQGMKAVLTAKFASDPRLAAALSKTGDTFLLHHVSHTGRESTWSNNCDGSGLNWLGLLLMLVRDRFSGREAWTEYLQGLFDTETGSSLGHSKQLKWQDNVRQASLAVREALQQQREQQEREERIRAIIEAGEEEALLCMRPGCGKPTWNSKPWDFCSPACQEAVEGPAAPEEEAGPGGEPDSLRAAGEAGEERPASADGLPQQLALPPLPEALALQGTGTRERFAGLRRIEEENRLALHDVPGVQAERESSVLSLPNMPAAEPAALVRSTTFNSVDWDMQVSRRDTLSVSKRDTLSGSRSVRSMEFQRQRTASWGPQRSESFRTQPDGIDVNKPGIIPSLIFASVWVGSIVGVLVAVLWVYVFEEVRKHEELATGAAVAHARIRTAEILAPAKSVFKVVSAGFRGGSVSSLSDYAALALLLGPHFEAQANIREVELAGPPEDFLGSVRVSAAPARAGGGIDLQTDRPDCVLVEGRHGCTLEAMRANTSAWYRHAFGIGSAPQEVAPAAFWHGPGYSRSAAAEVVCGGLCWRPTYAFVGRAPGGPPAPAGSGEAGGAEGSTTTTEAPVPRTAAAAGAAPPVLVRAAVDAEALRDVVEVAETISRGQAVLCTVEGSILVAADMAAAVHVEDSTGIVRPARVWELEHPWASKADGSFVRKAKPLFTFVEAGFRVSAWSLGGGPSDTLGLGSNLRVILAVPGDAFYDAVMGPLVPWVTATAATPVVALVSFTLTAGLLRCCLAVWRRHQAAMVLSQS